MIFVTVGTHEQQFNRLIKCVDELKRDGLIEDDVFIQTGYSDYVPKYCRWKKMIPSDRMDDMISNARIVITHGGPSSFLAPLVHGKIPIVVPRMKQYKEHVNDHQVRFCRSVVKEQKNIILIEDITKLRQAIYDYDKTAASLSASMSSNNSRFIKDFEKIAAGLMRNRK